MTDNDKILINAYLDNELSADESKYVSDLLETDSEALDYANGLKMANNSIESFFKSNDFKELNKDVDIIINKFGRNNKSFLNTLLRYFSNLKFSGPVAVFALFGIFVIPTFIQDELNDSDLIVFEVDMQRSENASSINIIVKETVDSMIEMDIEEAIIAVQETNLKVRIKKNIFNECYKGSIKRDDDSRDFSYCPNSSSNDLTFE
jgi:hypothetical protein